MRLCIGLLDNRHRRGAGIAGRGKCGPCIDDGESILLLMTRPLVRSG
jgi:hypothetical protein